MRRAGAPPALPIEEQAEAGQIDVEELVERLRTAADATAVLDVRTDSEFASGHIQGATHMTSEALLDEATGEAWAREYLSSLEKAGKEMLVVHCMYSQARGPSVATKLAHLAVEGPAPNLKISLLTGGFHKYFNSLWTEDGAGTDGLIAGVDKGKWRRTDTHGWVEEDAVQAIEMLDQPVEEAA